MAEETEQKEVDVSAISICGRTVNFTGHVPMKIKDWRALKKQGVTARMVEDSDPDAMAKMLFYVINKADPSITQDQVDDLTMDDAGLLELIKALGPKEGLKALDRPS